jgi:hypothetical protein
VLQIRRRPEAEEGSDDGHLGGGARRPSGRCDVAVVRAVVARPKSELELGFLRWRVLVTPLPIEDWGGQEPTMG